MKAWVLHGINDIQLEEVETPTLSEQEVLVQVKAFGICGSDIPRIYQTGAYSHPLIPGHEFSGQVVQLGANVDKTWQDQRVAIFPLIPCQSCLSCQKQQYEMCAHYSYLGSRQDGGFAKYVAVPVWNLLPLPEGVSYEAAAMLEPMSVATHAMSRLNPSPSDTIASCGLGTIGLLLAMLLKEAGIHHLLFLGNKDFQKEKVVELGFSPDAYCDTRTEDIPKWLLEHTNHHGVDCFFECVGKNVTISLAIECTAPTGSIMLVGNPHQDLHLKKEIYWKILRRQLHIQGTWNSSFTHHLEDDWHYILERLKQQTLVPTSLITHRLPFEQLEQALHIMKDKTENHIKIILSL